ncbi:Hypothetical predicted protein, partial [Paramuricea clavata]
LTKRLARLCALFSDRYENNLSSWNGLHWFGRIPLNLLLSWTRWITLQMSKQKLPLDIRNSSSTDAII